MISVPFTERFLKISSLERHIFFANFLATTAATVFLIAPSVYHRLHWRRDVQDKEEMLQIFNFLALIGGGFLGLSILGTVFLVTHFLFGRFVSLCTTLVVLFVLIALWFGLPLSRRKKG